MCRNKALVSETASEYLRVGAFTIRLFENGEDYWIEHDSGEGMQVFRKNFERLIENYFEEEF